MPHRKALAMRAHRWWADRSLRTKVLLVVGLPVLLFAIAASSFVVYEAEERRAATAVAHTNIVQTELENLLLGLVDAETGVRGYLLTDDVAWLDSYERAVRDVPASLERLSALLDDDRGQASRLASIRQGTESRLGLLARLRATEPQGGAITEATRTLMIEGKTVMDALRTEIGAMRAEAASTLAAQEASAAAIRSAGTTLTGLSLVVALGGGIIGAALLSSGVVNRTRRLEDNARRLVRGEPPLALPDGRDEIGQLGVTLAEVGALLAAREAALRRSERFLDSIIENLPDMVVVKDAAELRFVRLNRAGETLLGHSRETFIGRTDHDVFDPEAAAASIRRDRKVLDSGQMEDIPDDPIETEQGRRILHTKKIPILDERGRPAYLLGISEDITERKEVEAALGAAQMEAQRANRAKSEFLSRMSHELRTPLNAVLGFAQVLELDELSPEQRENVAYIRQAGDHLLGLINEVLDISRIETGQMTISPEPVEVAELMNEVVTLMGPLAQGRSIAIHTDASTCSQHVLADRQRLRQILVNLAANAIKYNREGGTVTIGCRPDGGDGLQVRLTDTGYGIAPEQQERLFMPFERLGAEGGDVEGTGMGLALSKGLVELMGGTIGVESEVDVGTTFWVRLAVVDGPLATYERSQPAVRGFVEPSAASTGKRVVLYIEDNTTNLRLVERVLGQRADLELLTAAQGRLGLELARQHRPNLILLDLHLSDLPGRDVLRELGQDPATRGIPVVIVSADATKSQIERLRRQGAADYLTKPIDVVALLELVRSFLDDGPVVTT